MGCWNESCMVTGLPILSGEPCTLVLLIESPYYNNGCYASNQYMPIFAIDGEYNDYGCIEDSSTSEYSRLIKVALNCIPNDVMTSKSEVNSERFKELIHKASSGNIAVSSGRGVTSDAKVEQHIYPVFIRKGVKDVADKNMNERRSFLKTVEKQLDSIGNNLDDVDFKFDCMLRDFVQYELPTSTPNPMAREIIADCIKYDASIVIPMLASIVRLNYLVEDLRKSWHIPSGSGSQEAVTQAHEMFADLYKEQLKVISEYWED